MTAGLSSVKYSHALQSVRSAPARAGLSSRIGGEWAEGLGACDAAVEFLPHGEKPPPTPRPVGHHASIRHR